MSGATVSEFLAYWEAEGAACAGRGDYAWMASLIPGKRVLEIGCGPGFGTQALLARGLTVLSVDCLAECLNAALARLGADRVSVLQADVRQLDAEQRRQIEAFAPDTVVCWLMGAPAETTGAAHGDGGQSVVAYREQVHRAVAELAAALPTVQTLHFVDRTAIPWQAKDIGRDTLLRYHLEKTLRDLPLTATRHNALFRKLEDKVVSMTQFRNSNRAAKSVVPTLASLLANRSQ